MDEPQTRAREAVRDFQIRSARPRHVHRLHVNARESCRDLGQIELLASQRESLNTILWSDQHSLGLPNPDSASAAMRTSGSSTDSALLADLALVSS